jgi:predicted RNA-binding protein with PIN domain
MRTLIDGYNVMFAAGLMGRKFRPEAFRKVRLRFLNDLAATLDPVDANYAPEHVPTSTSHKGISVLYAVDNDSADERIEDLIANHSNPRTLTVVSSDHRIQRAAKRKKAKVLSADEFLTLLDSLKERRRLPVPIQARQESTRQEVPTAQESAYWLEQFREVVESEEAREVARGDPSFPTDEEIARIEREVEEEFRR